jgi:hypothetical protein
MEVSLESLLTSCRAALQNNLPALARALSTRIYRVRLHGSFEIGLVINSKATQRDWSCGLVSVPRELAMFWSPLQSLLSSSFTATYPTNYVLFESLPVLPAIS